MSYLRVVGAGRFERPPPCAQGIAAVVSNQCKNYFHFLHLRGHRLQLREPTVVNSVAAGCLSVQHLTDPSYDRRFCSADAVIGAHLRNTSLLQHMAAVSPTPVVRPAFAVRIGGNGLCLSGPPPGGARNQPRAGLAFRHRLSIPAQLCNFAAVE
jgi:hypothetical protein